MPSKAGLMCHLACLLYGDIDDDLE